MAERRNVLGVQDLDRCHLPLLLDLVQRVLALRRRGHLVDLDDFSAAGLRIPDRGVLPADGLARHRVRLLHHDLDFRFVRIRLEQKKNDKVLKIARGTTCGLLVFFVLG